MFRFLSFFRKMLLGKQIEKADTTLIDAAHKDLASKGYKLLVNIKNRPTSLMDLRPEAVINDYRGKGWEVVICPTAYDIWGKNISKECSSPWGRRTV